MNNLKNKPLYLLKKKYIDKFRFNFENLSWKFSFECCYLGQNLRFHYNSISFEKSLLCLLPNEWLKLNPSKICIDIYIKNTESLNLELDWDNESSQDCISFDNYGIQRDFCAKNLESKVLLMMPTNLGDGFYNFLRWYLPREILKNDKVILHSSCVILNKDHKAYFFLGHSGAGKTTIADFAGERKVLGDDMNLISIEKSNIYAQAGAIGGKFYSDVDYSKKYKIGGFYYLVQSDFNKLSEMKNAQSYLKIISSFANLFWEDLENQEKERCFELAKLLVNRFKFCKLNFKKDASVYEVIDDK